MQEEVESRTLTLIINGSKLTGRTLKSAMSQYLAHRRNKKLNRRQSASVTPHGKQKVKQIVKQGQGVSTIDIPDSIRDFERIARKYGVDYAIKRDRSSDPPRFLIFFKSRDADALTAAFNEYAGNKVKKASRPSVLQRLAHFKELVKNTVVNREKRRDLER